MKLRKWAELFVMVIVSLGTFVVNAWLIMAIMATKIILDVYTSDDVRASAAFQAYNKVFRCLVDSFRIALLVLYSFMFFFILRYIVRGFKGPLFPRLYRNLSTSVFGVMYLFVFYAFGIHNVSSSSYFKGERLSERISFFLHGALELCVPFVVAILFVLFYDKLFASRREPYKSSAE